MSAFWYLQQLKLLTTNILSVIILSYNFVLELIISCISKKLASLTEFLHLPSRECPWVVWQRFQHVSYT